MAQSKKFGRVCTICGKHYQYCSQCSDFDHMERWHDAYCSANCKDLYNVCAGFINGWLTPKEEAARLAKLDLSYKNKLVKWVRDVVDKIQMVNFEADPEPAKEETIEEKEEVKETEETVAITEPKNIGVKVANEFKDVSKNAKRYKPKNNEKK